MLSMWNLDGSVDSSWQDPLCLDKFPYVPTLMVNIQGGGYPETPKLQNQPNSAQTAGSQRRLVSGQSLVCSQKKLPADAEMIMQNRLMYTI